MKIIKKSVSEASKKDINNLVSSLENKLPNIVSNEQKLLEFTINQLKKKQKLINNR